MAYPGDRARSIEDAELEHADQPHPQREQYSGWGSFFIPFGLMLALLFGGVWIVTTMRNVTTPTTGTQIGATPQPEIAKPGPLPSPSNQSK